MTFLVTIPGLSQALFPENQLFIIRSWSFMFFEDMVLQCCSSSTLKTVVKYEGQLIIIVPNKSGDCLSNWCQLKTLNLQHFLFWDCKAHLAAASNAKTASTFPPFIMRFHIRHMRATFCQLNGVMHTWRVLLVQYFSIFIKDKSLMKELLKCSLCI